MRKPVLMNMDHPFYIPIHVADLNIEYAKDISSLYKITYMFLGYD